MTEMRCKPGDLAIVIDAYNTSNLGMIVRVVGPQDMNSDLVIHDTSGVWIIESHHLMAWACGEKITYSTKGPALDCQLKPIRGLPLGRDIADGVKELYKEKSLKDSNVDRQNCISAGTCSQGGVH